MSSTKRSKKKRQNIRVPATPGVGMEVNEEVSIPDQLPVLPSYELVPFPSVIMALYAVQPVAVSAAQSAMAGEKLVLVVAQPGDPLQEPSASDLFKFGVVASVLRIFTLSDGRCKILLRGITRARALSYKRDGAFFTARIQVLENIKVNGQSKKAQQLMANIRRNLQTLVEYEHVPEEMLLVTEDIDDPAILSDVILAHYKLDPQYGQSLLEELSPLVRLERTDKIISDDLQRFFVSQEIRGKAQGELAKGQHEYYLREQLKQIQRELGEGDTSSGEHAALHAALDKAALPDYAKTEAEKQLGRLERMHPETSEYAMLRTYLEWLADLPWSERTKDRLDLKQAKEILEEDHFGLAQAKDRILEYLSVRKLKKESKGPILCFVGPPGVGKTSLGRSIARALNRKFFRMSLGGVRDEAEIRGHRRTYVGALPGRIIQGIKEVGTRNPVFVLDELDKVGADFRGDPAAALLEILDPEQNKQFRDHYVNLPFDLSEVLFVATANTLDTIPEALLDRLEVIFISGYTTDEKHHIAKKYLIPRQLNEQGLEPLGIAFKREAVVQLIESYTREAGVRNLEREIASACRKMARSYVETGRIRRTVDAPYINKLLGPVKFEPGLSLQEDSIGIANGLAWTRQGGEVMPIEALIAAGKGELNLTGHLGTVMQESARAAMFYARANAARLGFDPEFYQHTDIHIHVPSGATPKDGPSAGVTIVTALVSALSERKVSKDVAMTGEITLRGQVLAVGGVKEKALAALRYGIKNVIIPQENMKDLQEIPKEQREQLEFIPVRFIDEVLQHALCRESEVCVTSGRKVTVKGKSLERTLIVES